MNEDIHKKQAINATIRMLKTLKYTHDPETSTQVYDSLKEVLGRDFMGRVLQGVLTGGGDRILVIHDIPHGKRIHTIKLIREYTGCSLKTAKHFVDNVVFNGIREQIVEQNGDHIPYSLDDLEKFLQDIGVTVTQDIDLTG